MKRNQTAFMKLCLADALIKLMAAQDYDSINVNTICELAGVGRTTFYRHLDCKNSKEELLIFKINYEWGRYADLHQEDVEKDKGFALTCVIYQWIKYGFDEASEQVQKHIIVAFSAGLTQNT